MMTDSALPEQPAAAATTQPQEPEYATSKEEEEKDKADGVDATQEQEPAAKPATTTTTGAGRALWNELMACVHHMISVCKRVTTTTTKRRGRSGRAEAEVDNAKAEEDAALDGPQHFNDDSSPSVVSHISSCYSEITRHNTSSWLVEDCNV